jgi:uncharacterized YccA/Bax inhibitor family protein
MGLAQTSRADNGIPVGGALFLAISILASNFFEMKTGEWKATSRSTRGLLGAGFPFFLISVTVLSLGVTCPLGPHTC